MIRINLLPRLASAGPQDYPIVLVAGVAVVLLCLGGIGMIHTRQQGELNQAQVELSSVEAEYNKERTVIESARLATEQLRFIEEKEKWVLRETNSQREWGAFLKDLKDLIPKDTWLMSLEALNGNGTLKIEGRAFSLSSVANFILQMERSRSIEKLNLVSVVRTETIIEQNKKERQLAQDRQKNTDKVVDVPDAVPQLGFDTEIFEPMDFNLDGKFQLKPLANEGVAAPAAPTGAPPPPGGVPPAPQ